MSSHTPPDKIDEQVRKYPFSYLNVAVPVRNPLSLRLHLDDIPSLDSPPPSEAPQFALHSAHPENIAPGNNASKQFIAQKVAEDLQHHFPPLNFTATRDNLHGRDAVSIIITHSDKHVDAHETKRIARHLMPKILQHTINYNLRNFETVQHAFAATIEQQNKYHNDFKWIKGYEIVTDPATDERVLEVILRPDEQKLRPPLAEIAAAVEECLGENAVYANAERVNLKTTEEKILIHLPDFYRDPPAAILPKPPRITTIDDLHIQLLQVTDRLQHEEFDPKNTDPQVNTRKIFTSTVSGGFVEETQGRRGDRGRGRDDDSGRTGGRT